MLWPQAVSGEYLWDFFHVQFKHSWHKSSDNLVSICYSVSLLNIVLHEIYFFNSNGN